MRNTKKRGLVGAVGAVAAAAALALSGAVAASAAPTIPPGTEDQPTVGKVTIHKSEQGSTLGSPANGLPLGTEPTNPIKGVTFTAEQITSVKSEDVTYSLDLKTNAGWQNAAKLEFTPPSTWKFGGADATVATVLARTKNTGTATYENAVFEDLPVGLYLFTETAAPVGVTKSAPWVMTVPLTHPTALNEWLYDIHVYPKNSTTVATKTVEDESATKVGDTVSWTIKGDIPLVANPEFKAGSDVSIANLKFLSPTKYEITDHLDGRLTPDTDPVVLTLDNGGSVVLEVTNDYEVTWDPSLTPLEAGAKFVVKLTQAGREKLALAVSQATDPSSVKVQLVVKTVITAINDTAPAAPGGNGIVGDGTIKNKAIIFVNDASVTSNEPETRYGDILIEKVEAGKTATKLEGVTFQVFESEDNARNLESPITIGGLNAFTTDSDGVVRISGLRHSNYENGAEIADAANWKYYWIVETKAADGYELLAEPVKVSVTKTNQELGSATQIENVPHNGGFELPLTGGTGTLLLTILGVGILATVIVVARRRQNATAAE